MAYALFQEIEHERKTSPLKTEVNMRSKHTLWKKGSAEFTMLNQL